MVVKPDYGTRDMNDSLYELESRRINLLSQIFFQGVELTMDENRVLAWLCGLDDFTLDNIVSAFRKVVA